MTVANCSMGNAPVRINMQSQRGVLWACLLVLAVFGGACALPPCAMAQVSQIFINAAVKALTRKAAEQEKVGDQAEIDKFCAKHGTDVNKKNQDGYTLLHIAAKTEGVSVIQFLLEKGADVNAKSEYDYTPLHCAAEYNTNPEVIKLLINKGADLNANGILGTPLHHAAEHNVSPEVVKLLIENGADVNAKNWGGETPLHCAVGWNTNLDVIKTIIINGADTNVRDDRGKTPLDLAEARDNASADPLLTAAGALYGTSLYDTSSKDIPRNNYGDTPGDRAFFAARDSEVIQGEYDPDDYRETGWGGVGHTDARPSTAEQKQRQQQQAEKERKANEAARIAGEKRKANEAAREAKRLAERKAILAQTGAVDLDEELSNSGFDSLSDFTQYGNAKLNDDLWKADAFDKPAIEAKIISAKADIAKKTFYGEYAYSAADVKVDGNKSSFTMTIPTGFDGSTIAEVVLPFSGVTREKGGAGLGRTVVEYAFLTKDNKLSIMRENVRHASIVFPNGIFYARYRVNQSLALAIKGDTDNIKELVRNSDNYRVRVWFKNLEHSRNMQPEMYFRVTKDGEPMEMEKDDSVPNPFVTTSKETVETISADVVKIEIIKK